MNEHRNVNIALIEESQDGMCLIEILQKENDDEYGYRNFEVRTDLLRGVNVYPGDFVNLHHTPENEKDIVLITRSKKPRWWVE